MLSGAHAVMPPRRNALRRATIERQRQLQQLHGRRLIGRLALGCLHDELLLYPKPGLVSPVDNGSHDDMTAATFLRSLFALRHYFVAIAGAGQTTASFATLRRLGIAAEARMLKATGGVNTHRGAIFTLGLLAAALGHCQASGIALSPQAIRAALLIQWGDALAAHVHDGDGASHGRQAAARHAVGGAREEAALGLPSVFDAGLPALQAALAAGRSAECARIDAFFALLARISDTNLYHRGGADGAALARQAAREFVAAGATAQRGWKARAVEIHQLFVAHRLSPGGAADLLAATCLVHRASALTFG